MLSGNVLPVVGVRHSTGLCHLKHVLVLGKLLYKNKILLFSIVLFIVNSWEMTFQPLYY